MLAYRDPWREDVLEKLSVVDDRLPRQLEQARADGYVFDQEQLALPVRWREDDVIAALIFVGVQRELLDATLAETLPLIDEFGCLLPQTVRGLST